MTVTADEVRALARTAPERWSHLRLLHHDSSDVVEAELRHGELTATRRSDGFTVRERGAPSSPWTVRPLEPIYQSYNWAAMLDPYELGENVDITNIRVERFYDRPVWRFDARAEPGYDPICSCCPLVLSEVSQRLDHGDDWTAPAGVVMPDGIDLALDAGTGIVVSSHPVGGKTPNGPWNIWFENHILSAT